MTKRILLVDDDKINRRLLQLVLKREPDIEFFEAEDGMQALELIEEKSFDLVILDLVMPVMDGVETLRRIKGHENPLVARLPVVIYSSLEDDKVLSVCLEEGAADYFPKPLSRECIKYQMPLKIRNLLILKETQDQLNRTLRAVERSNELLLKYVKELEGKDLLIQRELDIARETQNSLLPRRYPNLPGVCFGAKYISSSKLSGDMYNVFHLPPGQVGISVADVSGHGVPSALIATMFAALLASALQGLRSPREVLEYLNRNLCETLSGENFLTFFLLLFDPETRRLDYSKAGHPEALLIHRDGSVDHLDTSGTILGMFEDVAFEERSVQLEAGDRVYLYTDGLFECMNSREEMYGERRMAEFLKSHRGEPIQTAIDALCEDLSEFSGSTSYADDVTIVGLEVLD